jgi:hypothetical protein
VLKTLAGSQGDDDGSGFLFVTGFDKSGTTWLRLLLDSHPEIVCRSHGHFFNFFREGEPYISIRGAYQEMADRVLESGWWRTDGKLWVEEDVVRQHAVRYVSDSLRAYSTPTSKFVGAKGTIQDCDLIREIYPASKLVGIVRDGRDVAVSFAYHFSRQKGKRPRITEEGRLERKFLEELARGWSQYVLHMAGRRDDMCPVRYEDLLEDPTGELTRLLGYLDVARDTSLVEDLVQKNAFERLSGGREPGEEDAASFYRKGVAGDWRAHFNDEDTARFSEIAGPALEKWGYEC